MRLRHRRRLRTGAVTTPYEGSTLELLALYVVEAQRRRGIGTALVEHVLAAAEAAQRAGVVLHVHPGNAPAVALYTRLGFTFTTDDLGPMMQHPFPQSARS